MMKCSYGDLLKGANDAVAGRQDSAPLCYVEADAGAVASVRYVLLRSAGVGVAGTGARGSRPDSEDVRGSCLLLPIILVLSSNDSLVSQKWRNSIAVSLVFYRQDHL